MTLIEHIIKMNKLLKRNYIAAGAHIGSAAVLLYFYNRYKAAKERSNFSVFRGQIAGPDTPNTCVTNTANPVPDECNVEIAFTKPTEVVQINIIYGALAFFIFTAGAHLWYATDGLGSGLYSTAIEQGWNPYRWFEYASSASLMSVLIGLIDGQRDAGVLFALFGITAAMMFNGFVSESLLRGHEQLPRVALDAIAGSTVSGWTLFVTLWTIILVTFGVIVHDVNTLYKDQLNDGKPIRVPTWVWIVIISQAVYFALFGLVQLIHIRRRLSGKSFNYESIENMYITLSYVSKLSLAGGIGYGLIFRVKNCPDV